MRSLQQVGAGSFLYTISWRRYPVLGCGEWRINMQPDLPWNVAGIPPEAREAARAAARRDGLSVGEWLTRKILRTLSEAAGGLEGTTENWRKAASASADAYRTVADSAAQATRDTEDMLARVSRSEDESQSATRRIEDHLKGVARRLDAAERSQAENNRAMSKAAAEINVAAREQAQAFDQLDGHVMALADRLTRVEQHAAGNNLKDAVKGLHAGLSRLADQIAETAKQSGNQISTLAENVESLAGRLNQAEDGSRTLKSQLAAADERIAALEKDDGASQALGQLRDTVDRLAARFAEGETQTGGAMARLEDSVAKLEAPAGDTSVVDHRLLAIEHAIADLTARFDSETHNQPQTDNSLEESVRALSEKIEESDHQHRRDMEDMRAALEAAQANAAAAAPAPAPAANPAAPAADPFATLPAAPQADAMPQAAPQAPPEFDLPPFPHAQAPGAFPAHDVGQPGAAPPPFDPAPGFAGEQHFSGVQQFDTVLGQPEHGGAVDAQSYIASTRRNARAAAEAQVAEAAPGGFAWGTAAPAEDKREGRNRYLLIGGIAAVLVVALVAGVALFRTVGMSPPPQPATSAAPQTPVIAPSLPGGSAQPSVPAASDDTSDNGDMAAAETPAETNTSAPTPSAHAHPAPPKPKPAARPAQPKPQPKQQKTASVTPMDRLLSAARAGSATAETVLGLKYLDGNGVAANEAEAARWLERAAKQNQPVAEYRLGTLYERGHGVPANPKLAATWYEASAKQGNRKAMHNLAVAYAQGSGVRKNFTVAAQWFTKAADLGLRDSQFNLAVLYERGLGVQQSLTDAYKWYAVAAAQGDAESKARVAALSTQLNADARAAAQRSADSFKPKALNRAANTAPTMAAL